MKIELQRKSFLSIREQIKRQIRMLIENGELVRSQPLPSARDLASVMKVNRNTVTQAYKELSSEGILEIVIGSGTFVKKDIELKPKKTLDLVFGEAIQNARNAGFTIDEIGQHFLNRLSTLTTDYSKKRILVVECNEETISYLCNKLSEELTVQAEGVLIQELESDRNAASVLSKDKDLVVCGFNHLEELSSIFPESVKLLAVLYQVDAKVINALTELPKGTKVGLVCANQRSAETLYNSSYFSGGKELKRILAGYSNSEKLEKVVHECDVIFATHFVHERMQKLLNPNQKLINVRLAVDSSSMDLIREKLSQ